MTSHLPPYYPRPPNYPEVLGRHQLELLLQLVGRATAEAVEDVVVAFLRALADDARLLEQVVGDETADDLVLHEAATTS